MGVSWSKSQKGLSAMLCRVPANLSRAAARRTNFLGEGFVNQMTTRSCSSVAQVSQLAAAAAIVSKNQASCRRQTIRLMSSSSSSSSSSYTGPGRNRIENSTTSAAISADPHVIPCESSAFVISYDYSLKRPNNEVTLLQALDVEARNHFSNMKGKRYPTFSQFL